MKQGSLYVSEVENKKQGKLDVGEVENMSSHSASLTTSLVSNLEQDNEKISAEEKNTTLESNQ